MCLVFKIFFEVFPSAYPPTEEIGNVPAGANFYEFYDTITELILLIVVPLPHLIYRLQGLFTTPIFRGVTAQLVR